MYFLKPFIHCLAVAIIISMEVNPVLMKDTSPRHPPGNRPDNHEKHGDHNNHGIHGNRPGNHGSRPGNHGSRPGSHGDRPDKHGDRPDKYGNRPGSHGYGNAKPGHRGRGSFISILQANQKLTAQGQDKLFQGDVLITEELRKAMKNGGTDYIVLPDRVVSRGVSSVEYHKWPLVNGAAEIPYRIESSSDGERSLIEKAIVHWTDNVPCLRFVPRTWQYNFISFFKGQGCYSYVGRVGGNQRLSIGDNCKTLGIATHEIGHALGFWHEQSRPDRDEYVKILWDNIQYGKEGDFKKILNGGSNDFDVDYDYTSLMHYGPTVYAKRQGLNTIVKRNGGTDFGSATELSPKDIEQARRLYCPGTTACQSLYDNKHKHCSYWMGRGYCQTYKEYMYANCKKSCICG